MARQRRNYKREFKLEAVKLVTEKGYSVAEAARSLGIGETLLRSWKQAFETEGDQAFPGHGNLPAIEEELRQLRADRRPRSDEEFRRGAGTRRARPDRARGRGARVPRAERRGQVDHHPRPVGSGQSRQRKRAVAGR